MKACLIFFSFLIPNSIYAQMDMSNIEDYKEIIFNVVLENNNSIGTAFVVGKSENHVYLITARHVISSSQNVILTSINGKKYTASLIEEHDVYDLALLETSLFPLSSDRIPIVSDIAMNDEVVFFSLKDLGKILPSNRPGIIRDITGESINVIIDEVELGHSGSPIFCISGIAGIILKKGRFTECINILLVKEIIEIWANGEFQVLLEERAIERVVLPQPGSTLNKQDEIISIEKILSDESCFSELINLVDQNLHTSWSCSGKSRDERNVLLQFYGTASISKIKIYISNDSTSELPIGSISFFNENNRTDVGFNSALSHKENQGDGYWYTYIFKKPILATKLAFQFGFIGDEIQTINFNEIQCIGIPL